MFIKFQGLMAVLFIFIGGGLSSVVELLGFIDALISASICAAVVAMKYSTKWRNKPRPFKVKCPNGIFGKIKALV